MKRIPFFLFTLLLSSLSLGACTHHKRLQDPIVQPIGLVAEPVGGSEELNWNPGSSCGPDCGR